MLSVDGAAGGRVAEPAGSGNKVVQVGEVAVGGVAFTTARSGWFWDQDASQPYECGTQSDPPVRRCKGTWKIERDFSDFSLGNMLWRTVNGEKTIADMGDGLELDWPDNNPHVKDAFMARGQVGSVMEYGTGRDPVQECQERTLEEDGPTAAEDLDGDVRTCFNLAMNQAQSGGSEVHFRLILDRAP